MNFRLTNPITQPRGRPVRVAGVLGAKVWVKLVDADQPARTTFAAPVFLTMMTKLTFSAELKPAEGCTKCWSAVYMVRWVKTRGERGR